MVAVRMLALALAVLIPVTASSSRGLARVTLANVTTLNEVHQDVGRTAAGELRGTTSSALAKSGSHPAPTSEVPSALRTSSLASVAIEPHWPEPQILLKPLVEGSSSLAKDDKSKATLARDEPKGEPKEKVQINPSTGEPISARNAALSSDKYGVFLCITGIIMFSGLFLWCFFLPSLVVSEWSNFRSLTLGSDRTFRNFLQYRFNNWMNAEGLAANTKLLCGGALSLVTAGAFFYWIVTGRSLAEGLWLVFLWLSASSVEAQTPRASGTVGVIVTVGGLVLMAVLLGTVTEFFAEKVQAAKEGRDAVIEGGHILVIGQSANTKPLLEELALADPDEPTTVVLMDRKSKAEIEHNITAANTQLGNLNLVVRSGRGSAWQDLKKVAADTASRIVIPEDPMSSREESDAANFGTLLTLKGKGWPLNGYVTAQCCLSRNDGLMRDLGPDPTLVVNGERLGRLMVQSARDHGLCEVFGQIIGFDGDEFYSSSSTDLGVVGWKFRDIAFSLPTAVPLGILDEAGEYLVNPERDRIVKESDQILLLAEDEDSIGTADKEYFNYVDWMTPRKVAHFEEANPNDNDKATVLVCNFSDRGVGCAIIFALNSMLAPGSEVDIYCGMSKSECQSVLDNAQKRQGTTLNNLKLNINSAPSKSMSSLHFMEALRINAYDHIFVLADSEAESYEKADQKTVAMIIQIRRIVQESGNEAEFHPVVETCTKIAEEQLRICGITNVVNTNLIMARALALVTMKQVSHGVLIDLLSENGNNFDIQDLKDYLTEGEKLPQEISFAEATALVFRAAQQILIGWSEELDGKVNFIINPKDKMETRPWQPGDRLVVIKDV